MPSPKSAYLNPVVHAWLQSCMRSETCYYAFVWAAALHQEFLLGKHISSYSTFLLRQSYKTQAISRVRSEISSLHGLPSDDLIVSILILAAHGAKRDRHIDHSHPKSPLAKSQLLDFYANLEYEHTHQDALYQLVARKGGLENVETCGLAETLQL